MLNTIDQCVRYMAWIKHYASKLAYLHRWFPLPDIWFPNFRKCDFIAQEYSTEFRRQVVYLSCLSVTVTFFSCFTKIREYYYEEGMEEYYNLFFQDVLCAYSEQGVKVHAVLVIVIMLAAFYVITSNCNRNNKGISWWLQEKSQILWLY